MGGGMGGGQRKKKGISKEEAARLAKEERELKTRQIKAGVVGEIDTSKKKDESADKEDEGPFKETTLGYRWVAITGISTTARCSRTIKEEAASRTPPSHTRNTVRLDLERRTLQDDGTWSAWKKVDEEKNLDILDDLPANEEELAPVNVLPEGLVDPLPFLNAGLLEKVHIASSHSHARRTRVSPEEPKGRGRHGTGDGGYAGDDGSSSSAAELGLHDGHGADDEEATSTMGRTCRRV